MKSKIIKGILIISGSFFLVLGIVGIFLPILPTTPFLLLSAACYVKGSKKFYRWLINNKLFGEYIKNYQDRKGIPIKLKLISITLLWITIIFSSIITSNLLLRILLIIIAIGVTIHIIMIKTLEKNTH